MIGDELLHDDLYREVILDHYRNPRNRGRMDEPTVQVNGHNPLCGDKLELSLRVQDGRVIDSKIQAHGCSISQASASMMTEAIQGQPLDEVERVISLFKGMLLQNGPKQAWPESMEELKSLEGVRQYPVRIKCALLAWNALLQALGELKGKSHDNGR
jgi:nitrogen fixation NifU-like protein